MTCLSSRRIGILGFVSEDEGECMKRLLVAEIILVANLIETTDSLFPLILHPKEIYITYVYERTHLILKEKKKNPKK